MRGGALLMAALLLAAAGPPMPESPVTEPPGAESCTGCHVAGGGVGVLQGRPAPDLAREMEAYRSGDQPATLMNRIVKGFSPEEVKALSTWFAAQ
jgi:sulfide dehydrogenase cytochrome subunit